MRTKARQDIAAGSESVRLHKKLAALGIASRREIERWIAARRITVNGACASLGDSVGPGDRIRIDGQPVVLARGVRASPRVLCYHKPVGEICTRVDARGRPSVFAKLPAVSHGRWVSVGRLDINTSGLLLFSNDGELAHRLMHPSSGLQREYAVRVRGEVSAAMQRRLRRGVALEDGMARFQSISDRGGEGVNHWFHVVIGEGRTREVRRLWGSQGVEVSRLIRVRYGPVALGRKLRAGHWEELPTADTQALARLVTPA